LTSAAGSRWRAPAMSITFPMVGCRSARSRREG
jgi:hypothetical protein